MRYGSLILLIALILVRVHSPAQSNRVAQKLEFSFRNIDFTNGLQGNYITAITQDHRGFVWIGSLKGLQRYDGSRFVTYSNSPVDELGTDQQNNQVWIQSPDNEISQLNLLNNVIQKKDPVVSFDRTAKKYIDWNRNTWLFGGSYMCNEGNRGLVAAGYSLVQDPESKHKYHASMVRDTIKNVTWINNTEHGLLMLDEKSGKVYSPTHNPLNDPLLIHVKDQKILPRHLFLDSRGNIWLFSWAWMFYRFNSSIHQLSSYSTADIILAQNQSNNQKGWVNAVMEDNHGKIWMATAGAGLLQYDHEKDNFNYILYEQKNSSSLQYNFEIFDLYQDKEENIWAGSDKGISIFNPYRQNFTVFRHDERNPGTLPKTEINAFIETNKGEFMVGTWGSGISVFDRQKQFKKNITFPEPYQKNLVWCLLQNYDGMIWAGCQYGYLHIIDPGNLAVETIRPAELENSTIRCMKKDKQGNIWFGLHNGKIAKWEKLTRRFYPYSNTMQFDSLLASPVVDILIDSRQNFWISTWKEFKEFDPEKMMFIATRGNQNTIPGVAAVNYYGIEELNDSTLVIGAENGGLNLFNKRSKTFQHLPINEDNIPYSAYAVKKDAAGNIWFTADHDIYKYNPVAKKFTAINAEKGMITSSFPSSQFYIASNGEWFTWSFTEVLGFFPDRISQLQVNRSPVTIAGFKVFDKPVLIDSLLYAGKPVLLSHRQNFFTIEFSSLNFSGNPSVEYYYQLQGIDEDWVFAGTKLFANYTNLSPGEYSFRVKSDSNDQITSFKIIIGAPFWQTGWFRILCGVLTASLIYLLVRWRIKSIRHEAGLKHRIAETEMMALRAQMNPHFIFNCLNAIDNLIQTNQKGKATSYLNRFARMIRAVLDSSKNNLVSFHKDYDTLKLFLELEQFRCSDKFQYEIKADPELLNSDIKVPPLIAQPFVENAIHHGLINKEDGECKLTIDIVLEKDQIKYTITDNGIGRKQAVFLKSMNKPEHIPYGLEITRKRVELHNHNGVHESILITDLEKDNRPAGTKVEFWLSPQ